MIHTIYLPGRASFLITIAAGTLLWLLLSNRLPDLAAADRLPGRNPAKVEAGLSVETAVDLTVLLYLKQEFCSGDLCPPGAWDQWIIITPDNAWTVTELQRIHTVLLTTRAALNLTGLDGDRLLRGYRFRNTPRIYLDARHGILGRVFHDSQEIELSDGAIIRQEGFFLYHELGHVADKHLDHALTRAFQQATSGESRVERERTVDGFWLDEVARDQPSEAMADAFALWVILNHTADPQPVFWLKPDSADFRRIADAMENALRRVNERRTGLSR